MSSAESRSFAGHSMLCPYKTFEDGACYASIRVPDSTLQPELLFYDGHCALCHRSVKFVLRHDKAGTLFRFAPLHGPTFEARVPVQNRTGLPGSVIVLTSDGALLVRSDAFLHVLRRLGGGWKVLAAVIGIVPRGLRDAVYDLIARVRYRVFGKREDWCPVMAPDLRARFDP